MDEKALLESLKTEGYDKVYVWDAQPNEDDPSHAHDFDTKLVVLKGQIEIEMDGVKNVLKKGDKLEIPRKKVHAGCAGLAGCRYIVAEKR